jgi:hypothetical protein
MLVCLPHEIRRIMGRVAVEDEQPPAGRRLGFWDKNCAQLVQSYLTIDPVEYHRGGGPATGSRDSM